MNILLVSVPYMSMVLYVAGVRSFELLNLGVQLLVGTAGSDDDQHNWANIATAVASTVKVNDCGVRKCKNK
jgi:hypothetical protein